jgi:HNH endonuclease
MPKAMRPLADRFWEKVQKSDECWLWTGAIDTTGYGRIGLGRRTDGLIHAHRLSWQLHLGSIPPELEVCHCCDNRACVNIWHLFLGTRQDNMRDARRKQRIKVPSRWYPGVWNIYEDQTNVMMGFTGL